jgi:AraC-like DNA-binding protein
MCLRFRLGLAERARQEGAAWGVCDAGLREGVVTLVRGGVEVGFLLIGGCRGADTAGRQRRRTEHLLSRLGEAGRFGEHGALFSAAREVPEEYFSATLRLLASAQAAGRDRRTGKAGTAGTAVRPAAVQKALGLIRARALTEEIRLGEVAEECGVSAEHLSRLFRRHAGVGFQEYVARFRVESVCDRLVHDARSVTEIALGCGFSSLAQFYRAFAKFTGTTPQAYRRGRAP